MNIYAYVGGDPINAADPSGTDTENTYSSNGPYPIDNDDEWKPLRGYSLAELAGGHSHDGMGMWDIVSIAGGRHETAAFERGQAADARLNSISASTGISKGCLLSVICTAGAVYLASGRSTYIPDSQLPPYASILVGRRVVDPRNGNISLVNIPANYRLIPATQGGGALLVPPTWTPGSRVNVIRIQPAGTGSVQYNPTGYFIVYGRSGSALNIRTGLQVRDTAPEAHNPLGGVLPPMPPRVF
jgi:hypothetical protein